MSTRNVTLQFITAPVVDDIISLSNNLAINPLETMKVKRIALNITKIGSTNAEQATNFVTAFNLDWNYTLLYDVLFDGIDKVTIAPITDGTILAEISSYAGVTIIQSAEIPAPPGGGSFFITSTPLSEASADECDNIRVTVNCNELFINITSPVIDLGLGGGSGVFTYSFDFIRGSGINISIDGDLGSDTKRIQLPDKLSGLNITIIQTPSLSGTALQIEVTNINLLTLQYSLDNIAFQSSKIFTGQSPGNYTIYVKDQYGCTVSKDYTVLTFGVDTFGIQDPFFYVSKSNSAQFIERVVIDGINIYKTDENVFAKDVLTPINGFNSCALQLFQKNDTLVTQFKSNYENVQGVMIDEAGTVTDLLTSKLTTNIGRKDRRDGVYYKFDDERIGIYFLSGNTYNYDTGLVNGEYTLNGNLPEFAIVGELLTIDNAVFKIEQVLFDKAVGYNVIIVKFEFIGSPTSAVIASIYNIQNYEVYEFNSNFSSQDGLLELQIQMTDSRDGWDDVTFVSENIDIKTLQDNTLELIYYNKTNSDIFYETGIQHLLRLDFDSIEPLMIQEFDNSINDNDTVLVNSTVHEANKITFSAVPNEIAKKIVLALSHRFVFINRIGYVKNGDIELEPVDNNSSRVIAELIKTGLGYTANGENELLINIIDMPALLESNGNYIKL